MKKFLLLLVLVSAGLLSSVQAQIQTLSPVPNQRFMHEERSVVFTNTHTTPTVNHKSTPAVGHSTKQEKNLRALTGGLVLNKQRIGSAGNLLTVDDDGSDQLSTDALSNSVVFIHRMDPSVITTSNLAEYGYDISGDGGVTWTSNLGPVTINGRIDNNNVNGRFPQAVIFNPNGSVVPDSNYLVYSGTWHDDCSSCQAGNSTWTGQMRGKAQLDGDTSTYTVSIDTVNGGHVAIASGFCAGAPGVFWNLNEDYTGTFATSGNAFTRGLIVEKGVWNAVTKTVSWKDTLIPQIFDSTTSSSGVFSIATAFDIAFDPSGQYGWISCLGDISSNPTDSVYSPIFWYSRDSGATWNGPIQINLDSLPDVLARLYPTAYNGAITSGVPTTSFEEKLTVDYLGNPHLLTTVGNGTGYSIQENAGYIAYDINYNANRPACDSNWNGWAATFIDSVYTLEGTYTTDAVIEYNRPQVSRSKDGKKLFFYWLDSDYSLTQADTNEYPNLFTRAFDLELHTSTPTFNLTQGDSLFGGSTSLYPNGGLFLPGANFPVVANTAIQNGNNYNVGLVLTQIDYNNFPDGGSVGSSANPAAFWYINNITFSTTDFSIGQSATVQVVGSDTEIIVLGSSYVDSGAIIVYTDTSCFGISTLHLVTDSSNLNIGQTGTYYIYYTAEDGSGNSYGSASRTVEVVAPPVANFGYTIPSPVSQPSYLAFHDSSTNQPTSWTWNFGDHSSDSLSYAESPSHLFAHTGTYDVCLTAANAYGHNQKCKQINVVSGINNVELSQHINLFPNPSTGKVFIAVDANVTTDYTVSVYDMLGNTVVAAIEHKSGAANLEMDLGLLANGTYMVKIQTADQMAVKRLDLIKK